MMLSALLTGLIVIAAATSISESSSVNMKPDKDTGFIYMVKDELDEFETAESSERRALNRMVDSTGRFSSKIEGNGPEYNLTISSSSSEYKLALN